MKLLLQHKILFGYLILISVIGCMMVILTYARSQIRNIESENIELQFVRRSINTVHRQITILATMGESVAAWDTLDCTIYHIQRIKTDTLLQKLKQSCTVYVRPEQIDTLRLLLEEKESHLRRIMEAFRHQETADSLIAEQLPKMTSRASRTHTVIRKKKGIAGWFGKKDTLRIPVPATELQSLNRQLIALRESRDRDLEAYTDSLRLYNRELNGKLHTFITYLDGQAQEAFRYKEEKISEAEARSFRLIAGVVCTAILLLVISHFVIIRDLRCRERDRKAIEDALDQNRALSAIRKKIIMTLSHDIRGPLNAISGSAELAMDTRDRKRRNSYLANILDSSRHITRLANSLLDLSRLNEAKETLNPVQFRLRALLGELASEYVYIANNKGLSFIKDIDDINAIVYGDADRIEQIIGNILSNAVKFTKSGEIRFHARYGENILTVEISDTGIGMDEATIARVFHPFERAAPDMDSEGFGLGLSITKGLVNLLDGKISVTSRPNEGSKFMVEIPLPATDFPVEENAVPANEKLRLPQRVLIADDDPIQLRIVTEMLERNGMYCRACTDAKEVVNELRKENYDLLLTDIQMRGTGGFKLLSLLRLSNIGNSQTIPVAAMTARNDENPDCYTEAGFTGCIRKPFSMNELLHFLSSIWKGNEEHAMATADFDALISRTGDRKWTLDTFIKESETNRKELQKVLQHMNMDLERLEDTLHRMFPTWEQLGIAHELEAYHSLLKDGESDEAVIRRHTEILCERIHGLMAEAESMLARPAWDNDKHSNA